MSGNSAAEAVTAARDALRASLGALDWYADETSAFTRDWATAMVDDWGRIAAEAAVPPIAAGERKRILALADEVGAVYNTESGYLSFSLLIEDTP